MGQVTLIGNNNKEERTWAVLCHALTLIGLIIPFGNLVAPLVVWLIKKNDYPLVDEQGKESINFQITICIFYIISSILMIVLIGFLLIGLVGLFNVISVLIACIETGKGNKFHYPLTFRFIK